MGDGNWARGGSRKGQGEFLLHLHVEEAGQDGELWIGCVRWQGNGEGLFLVFALVGVGRSLAEQQSPSGHGNIGSGVLVGFVNQFGTLVAMSVTKVGGGQFVVRFGIPIEVWTRHRLCLVVCSGGI